jgi:glyoxylase-like metal-dependent hydrolase (beta-lactamase superfamily II)
LIHCIPIEIPWPTGPVNVYLVDDDPLTLVDTGPNLDPALVALEAGLADLGRRIEDVERVLVTHHHRDHMGLASIVKERSGAEVWALADLATILGRWAEHDEHAERFFDDLMLRHGVPADVVAANNVPDPRRIGWDPTVEVDRRLQPGDTVDFAKRTWKVSLRPGHSPFDTLFHDEHTGDLFVGDHLLEHISPNPVITPPGLEPVTGRPESLLDYRRSLRMTRDMPARRILCGHGKELDDLAGHIDMRFANMERRRKRVRAALSGGPCTAHDVALQIWGDAAVAEPFLTISEVLGYVDLMRDDGEAIEERDNGVVHIAYSGG